MQIKDANNDQNIDRVYTKMSESFAGQNSNTKLSNSIENINYLSDLNDSDNKDELNLTYDHMYASNTDNGDLNPADPNCQNAESEVKFLKEWLMLHLDLIQQQNDEILSKDKTILNLKQENEMLKERINCMERGGQLQTNIVDKNQSPANYLPQSSCDSMTQDFTNVDEKVNVGQIDLVSDSVNNCIELCYGPNNETESIEEFSDNYKVQDRRSPFNYNDLQSHIKQENIVGEDRLSEPVKFEETSSNATLNSTLLKFSDSSFAISNSTEDAMKNLRMSIRRKRLCSSSSAFSNNDSVSEDRRSSGNFRKKRKISLKDEKMLTCNEQYVTQTGEIHLAAINDHDIIEPSNAHNLEVPRWRVKVYTSCYTMEGTENLDDEVYNKRHLRLENDERRRKRWDVQRIREQRIVEKLKQRQERIGSGSRYDEQSENLQSLWPTLEDIKYLEVCDQLPVSAFGSPIHRYTPSDFSLPWLAHTSVKKGLNRKSTVKRKATKR